jgi:hypothetical protein
MASRRQRPKKNPLTYRPFAGLGNQVDKELEEMGYAPSPSTPKQKGRVKRDKSIGANRTSSSSSNKETQMPGTSRASSARKKSSRSVTRSGGSSLQELGERALDVAIDDAARPFARGAFYAAGAVTGGVVAGNLLAKTGMQVPGFSK